MPLRDIFVLTVVLAGIYMAFRRPFVGLLLFSWLAYMRPQDLCYGFARYMRFSFYVGLTMLFGWWVAERHQRPFGRMDVRTVCMVILACLVSISLMLARQEADPYVMRYYFEFVKIMVVAIFTTGIVDTKLRLRTMLWTIAICLGFFGFKGGVFGILNGGQTIMRGPGGMLEDNNDFALALVMNVPLLFYLAKSEKIKVVRQITLVAVGFTMVTVILTHSRGAFLSMVAVLMTLAWRSGKLFQAVASLTVLSLLFLFAAPQHVLDRIATLQQGGAESSAGARFRTWETALLMINEYPVWGVGLRNFRSHFLEHVSEDFQVDKLKGVYVAHNSYLQIWAEGGTMTFGVYLLLLASVFFSCRWLRGLARGRPHLEWAHSYACMFEASTFGFLVGSTFLNRGHFDLLYHLLALLSCTVYVARLEALRGPVAVVESGQEEDAGIEVRWRTRSPSMMLPRWGR